MSTISSSVTLNSSNIGTYTFPITINGGTSGTPTVITLSSNLTLTTVNSYFIIGSQYITFNGAGYTITISSVTNYTGLIQNGTGTNAFDNVAINNLTISSSSSTITSNSGWICKRFFGTNSTVTTNVTMSNCSSNGPILTNGGCIGGSNVTIKMTSCFGSGTISSANGGGGLIGQIATNCTATNCYYTADIGSGCGGIFGKTASNCTATNCYATGQILNNSGGGIFGTSSSNCTATKCYYLGTSIGQQAGGIFGGGGNTCVANYCFSKAPIGNSAGGIFGDNTSTSCTANNCYSEGSIGTQSGGIFGSTSSSCTAVNCYSLGTIGSFGGAIFGGGTTTPTTTNCYSTSGGTWDSSVANSNLTGTPTYGSTTYTDGSIWTNIDPTSSSTPYKLNTYSDVQYSPNSNTIHTGTAETSGSSTFSGTHSIVATKVGSNSYTTTNTHITIDSSTGNMTFDDTTSVGVYSIKTYTVNTSGYYSISDYSLTVLAICFLEGTKILCLIDGEEKYIPIEELFVGMEVKTYLHGYKKVTYKTKFKYNNDIDNNFYRIHYSDKYGFGGTGNHSLLVDSFEKSHAKIDDKDLKLFQYDESFRLLDDTNIYILHHFVLENENQYGQYGVYANGVLCETMSEAYFKKPY